MVVTFFFSDRLGVGVVTPYNGLYRKALSDRDTFFGQEEYKREGISQPEG